MPPKRRTDKLPPYVYKRKHGYEMRVYTGKSEPMRSVKLCPTTAPLSEVWKAYEKQKQGNIDSLSWLLKKYIKSPQFAENASSTQKANTDRVVLINKYKMKSGKPFGGANLKAITSGVMRKYLDARKNDSAPVSGNKELALISTAWNWALERDIIKHPNPCHSVRRNKEVPRTRYVTEDEYNKVYRLASKQPHIQAAMELAYLCRMRRGEILNATRKQILKEGFDTLRTKGSRDAITLWSDRLTAAVNYDNGKVKSMYVIHDKRGQQITIEGFKSTWTRLKGAMIKAGIEPFNLNDLKAKGVSDAKGDKLKASGHKTSRMLAVYDRKKIVVEATE